MSPPALPAIAVENSLEALLAEHSTTARWVYLSTTSLVLLSFGVASMTTIEVGAHASGILMSAERQALRSLSEGTVSRMTATLGQAVTKGDTLVALDSRAEDLSQATTDQALTTARARIRDLERLYAVRLDHEDAPREALELVLPQFRAAYQSVAIEWSQATLQVNKASRVLDRLARLSERGFAAPSERESAESELANARESRRLALERRRAGWAEELATTRQQLADLERGQAVQNVARAARAVVAPVSGTIEELMPLVIGSTVRAGDVIGSISPAGALNVEALVALRDVVHLYVGMPARLLVDGFNVQEWGGVPAVVTSIGGDNVVVDGRAAFRVRLRPSAHELYRADGHRATLVKGLAIQVRFIGGHRRLLDVVRNRAGEWIDPAQPTTR